MKKIFVSFPAIEGASVRFIVVKKSGIRAHESREFVVEKTGERALGKVVKKSGCRTCGRAEARWIRRLGDFASMEKS